MGSDQYEAGQTLWGLFTGIWGEQLLSVALLFILAQFMALCARGKLSFVTALSLAMSGSFFLWPQLSALYAHFMHPKDFPLLVFHPHDFKDLPSYLLANFILLPLLLNQLSLLLLIFIWPLAAFAQSINRSRRFLGYVGLSAVLPVAWILDCFNQGGS